MEKSAISDILSGFSSLFVKFISNKSEGSKSGDLDLVALIDALKTSMKGRRIKTGLSGADVLAEFAQCNLRYKALVELSRVRFDRFDSSPWHYGTASYEGQPDHLNDFTYQCLNQFGHFSGALESTLKALETGKDDLAKQQFFQLAYIAAQYPSLECCTMLVAFAHSKVGTQHSKENGTQDNRANQKL